MIQSALLDTGNHSMPQMFLFVGLTQDPDLKRILFYLFLMMYLLTLMGNIGIYTVIHVSPNFQTPMYIFLSYLSLIDLCYSSSVVPNTMVHLLQEKSFMSNVNCAIQLFMFSSFGSTECLLFGVMAYDRYVAICNPLHYGATMTIRRCSIMFAASYIAASVQATLQTVYTFSLTFCGSRIINHFICDAIPLIRLSCSNTLLNEILISVCAAIIGGGSLFIIVLSYTYIAVTVVKIPSSKGKKRALSTCVSHLLCVILFYGTVLFNYLHPHSAYLTRQEIVASVFYTVVIPMLNPIIYSLRNKEVRRVMQKLCARKLTIKLWFFHI